MQLRRMTASLATAFLLVIVSGCQQATTISGEVTYEGQPLKKGNITFQPADGHGPSSGGQIVDGHYRLTATPGAKKVHVNGLETVKYNMSNPTEAGLAKACADRGDTSGTYDRVDPSIAKAMGNGADVEVRVGAQTVDFPLKRSTSPSPARQH